MADPICRWQNPFLKNVVKLISYLPKTELPKTEARQIVNTKFGKEFFGTPYQLACQLGLYHENEDFFFPKFTYIPTESEVNKYLENWIFHYSVPNPYTKKGFQNITPFSIHARLCEFLFNKRKSLNWDDIEYSLFGEDNTGNFDILCNSFDYSSVIKIDFKRRLISLKENVNYHDLKEYITVDTLTNRNDKEYFFDLFPLPNKIENESENWDDLQNFGVSEDEINQLNTIDETDLSQTEKVQLIKSRIGQGLFRRNLISDCRFCPITGVDDTHFLIASHIKPWRISNNEERLNQKNGLLLTPTYDKLFDKGFISFNTNKTLLISNHITQINRKRFHLTDNMNIPLLPIDGREIFLEYHRDELFKT